MVRGGAPRQLRCPSDSFYAYPPIDIAESDEVFVKELIRQKHVMVVHGSGFGQNPGTKHFRIVFLPDEKTLTKAYAAIGEFMQKR
jgi:alanine-synthesizing transaminase